MWVRERSIIIVVIALNRDIRDPIVVGVTIPTDVSVEVILNPYPA
jgi:hypothetical protein